MNIEDIISYGILDFKDELFFWYNGKINEDIPLTIKIEEVYYNNFRLPIFLNIPSDLKEIRIEYCDFGFNRSTDIHTTTKALDLKKRKHCTGYHKGFRTKVFFDHNNFQRFKLKDFFKSIELSIVEIDRLTQFELGMKTKLVRLYMDGGWMGLIILTLDTTSETLFNTENQ
jgi:hypothetical protein